MPDKRKLEGKVAFITGGNSGIGQGILERYLKEGALVVSFDLNESKENLGEDCIFIKGDVSDEAQVEKGIAAAIEKFGRLDICVNSAGTSGGGLPVQIIDCPFQKWDILQKVCLYGTFFGIKHAGRQMVKQGSGGVIINISSLNSMVPNDKMGAYCAAKAGVDQLTRVAAMELGPNHIRVCAINPGFTETPLSSPMVSVPGVVEEVISKTPLRRFGKPIDMANAALFLASEEASFITGVTLFVDGGQSLEGYPDVIPVMLKATAENQ